HGDHPARGRGPELRGDRHPHGLPDRHGALAHLPRPRGDRPGAPAPDGHPGRPRTGGAMRTSMTHSDNIDVDFELAPPDRLHAHHRRQLSAMLDGELSPDQARFMLRRLQHDAELAACWERWQVCGDVLRGRGHALLPADFSQRVAAALGAPPAAPAAVRAPARGRLARCGGGAVADGRAVALVEPSAALAPATPDPVPAPAPAAADAGDAAALLAVAAPAAAAVAEVPRRAASRGSTRSQAQRAAARRQEPAAAA